MSSGTADTNTRAGDITKFTIGASPDFSPVAQIISYYEDITTPSIKVNVTIEETGLSDKGPFGMLDNLPIRGGEEVILEIEDNQDPPNKLSFKKEKSLYVNSVSNEDPGTQRLSLIHI